ncbi:MAG TPA: MFS transporter [Sulfolobales archaeon]|nr:MFS transporter [Sulfolobales archaeon]
MALIGFVIAVLSIVRIPLAPVSGMLADLMGRRRALALGSLLSALGVILLLSGDLGLIVLGRVLSGVFGVFLTPVAWALVSEAASRLGRHGIYIAWANFATSLSNILGPAAASIIVTAYGFEAVFIVSASLLAALAIIAIPARDGVRIIPSYREILVGLRAALARELATYYVINMLEWYMLYSWLMLAPIYMYGLGFDVKVIGFLLTYETAVYAALQPLIGRVRDRYGGRSTLLLTAAAAYGLTLTQISLCENVEQMLIIFTLIAIASSRLSLDFHSNHFIFIHGPVRGLPHLPTDQRSCGVMGGCRAKRHVAPI